MKIFKYLALGGLLAMSTTSCQDWLDVNVDEDSPNSSSAAVDNRLTWIQRWNNYAFGILNFRTSCSTGMYYSKSANYTAASVTWNMADGIATTFYQCWFTSVGNNLNDLYNAAEAAGATHYMAMANIFHAMGFMAMSDVYGEMPYSDALGSSPVPKYDNGKAIYDGCLAKLDEAIELLNTPQSASAPSLAAGDFYNGGDVQKWIKTCYGLKARWLLRASKHSSIFDPQAILDCLSKAPQSIADNTVSPCYNSASDVTDSFLYYGDPVMANGNYCCASYNSNQHVSKFLYDKLVDMRGAGVEDPRFTKMIPASMSNIKLDGSGNVVDYTWMRAKPVDMYGEAERLVKGGAGSIASISFAKADTEKTYSIDDAAEREQFVADMSKLHKTTVNGNKVTVMYQKGSVFVNGTNYIQAGDTAYVMYRTEPAMTTKDDKATFGYFLSQTGMAAGAIGSTGAFQTHSVSDQEYVTYHEMCFIKAEVLFRKGDKEGALAAYKQGIQAHIDMMQKKLAEWKGNGYENPDMWPMDTNAIAAYMNSAAVAQDASELTMADIMQQKWLAMGCSLENWVDMRRFNYSAGNIENFGVVYPGFDRGPLFTGASKLTGTNPSDPRYWQRRWKLPATLELNYNKTEALAINAHALDIDVWSMPVWWDCTSVDEYYNSLK